MIGSRVARVALALGALTLVRCTKPRTELVVTVRSELAWGTGRDLQSLVVTVRRGSAEGAIRWQQSKVLGSDVGQWPLPLSFGLYPSDASDATPVWIEVLGCAARDGCVASGALVEQRAVVSYRPEQTVGLDLWLAARCRGVTCGVSERCVRETGRCELASRANDDVAPLSGGVVPMETDATSSADAAMDHALVDASTDADAPADGAAVDADASRGDDVVMDGGAGVDADVPTADRVLADADVSADRDADTPDVVMADVVDAPSADGTTAVDVTGGPDAGCPSGSSWCSGECVDHRNDTSTCSTAMDLGAWCGDASCGSLCPSTSYRPVNTRTGRSSQWLRARAIECSTCPASLRARITLDVPAGVDYDLYVYRPCGTLIARSLALAGQRDQVEISEADALTTIDSFDYYIEVRFTSGGSCSPWTLTLEARSSSATSCS